MFDSIAEIACLAAAAPVELPVCALECIDPTTLVDTNDVCEAVQENFLCIEVACGEEYGDIVLELTEYLRQLGCGEAGPPFPPLPTTEEVTAVIVVTGPNLGAQFRVKAFESVY